MKKAMIIFMALATFAISAQNKNNDRMAHRQHLQDNLTPEQKADLHSKKMTLSLDLNEAQQAKIKQVFLNMLKDSPKRTEGRKEMTDTQKYEAKSAMLDRKIAMKKALKEILTEEQFAKWEKSKQHKPRRFRGHKEQGEPTDK